MFQKWVKKTKTVSISGVPNSKVKVTKKSKYVNIYVKKTIRIYLKGKKVKIY